MSNSNFKEIVTKTVVGKGRKTFKTEHSLIPENTPDTVLLGQCIIHTPYFPSLAPDTFKLSITENPPSNFLIKSIKIPEKVLINRFIMFSSYY